MSTIPPDIRQRVVNDFGEPQAERIYQELLARIPEGLPNGNRPRHLRCILFLARGDRKQLDHYIEMCLCDTRDVMMLAEYEAGPKGGEVRKRDFSKPFAEASRKVEEPDG